MIHVTIVEDPEPNESESHEGSARCLKQFSSADRDYYRRRAEQEREAARKAAGCEARLAHEEMESMYRELGSADSTRIDPESAAELPAFPLNSKPAD